MARGTIGVIGAEDLSMPGVDLQNPGGENPEAENHVPRGKVLHPDMEGAVQQNPGRRAIATENLHTGIGHPRNRGNGMIVVGSPRMERVEQTVHRNGMIELPGPGQGEIGNGMSALRARISKTVRHGTSQARSPRDSTGKGRCPVVRDIPGMVLDPANIHNQVSGPFPRQIGNPGVIRDGKVHPGPGGRSKQNHDIIRKRTPNPHPHMEGGVIHLFGTPR
jgi:hypothetical protein